VLAYSTISQLGFMVAAVGMGAFTAGMFHLVTHAFFKALLFLAAGSVIQAMERGAHGFKDEHEFDPQDMREMGGLRKQIPVTFWVYLIGGLTLAGLAPLAGFFSKDEILAAASQGHTAVFVVLILAAFLTAFYIGRQIVLVFFGEARSQAAKHASESPKVVTIPLLVLAALSILGGLVNFPGLSWLESWLAHTLGDMSSVGFLWSVAGSSFALALLGLGLAWLIYGRKPLTVGQADPLQRGLGPVFTGMQHKWWVDELYTFLFLNPYNAIAQFTAYPLDQTVINGAGDGLGAGAAGLGTWLRRFQNGHVRSYALWMLVGLAAILTYLVLR